MAEDEKNELVAPKKQSLFPLTPEDIVDNALQNLDEKQARQVTQKAADEVVKIAVEKRRAEYRGNAAREEMRNVVENARMLDQTVSDYKINSTFETASGTTNVEIQNSKKISAPIIIAGIGLLALVLVLLFLLLR
jgi:GTP1/Obg family GTP-binding protein